MKSTKATSITVTTTSRRPNINRPNTTAINLSKARPSRRRPTKKERVITKLQADSALAKRMDSDSYEHIYRVMCKYVKALKDGRLIASIVSVSNSGACRNIKFFAPCRCKGSRHYHTWSFSYTMNLLLGSGWGFRNDALVVKGGGMDMVFHTNDCIIRTIQHYGFISKKQADQLTQERISCI